MKNWKMRSAIMVIVLVTTLIGIGALFLMASSRNQKALSESTSDNMATYLTAQANTIENFVKEKENNLKLFGKSYDVRRVLLNEEDAQAQEQAQKYTMEYYNSLDNWEGLYIGNWDTTVLTYQNSEMIGKTLREGERLEELRNAMLDAQYTMPVLLYLREPETFVCLCMRRYMIRMRIRSAMSEAVCSVPNWKMC